MREKELGNMQKKRMSDKIVSQEQTNRIRQRE